MNYMLIKLKENRNKTQILNKIYIQVMLIKQV